MRQFDVFKAPLPRLRADFGLLILVQSSLADIGDEKLFAPLVPASRLPSVRQRVIPLVSLPEFGDLAILLPSMRPLPVRYFQRPVGNLSSVRDRLTAAIDYLFLGI